MMPRVIAAATAACLTFSALPGATAPPNAPGTTFDELSRLKPGQRIRVGTSASDTVEGGFVAVSEGRLVLDRAAIAKHLPAGAPIDTVRTVWVRDRNTKRVALTSGVIGGLAGGILFGYMSRGLCDYEGCRDDWPGVALLGVVVGGGASALTGAVIGATVPRWRRVYSAEAPAHAGGLSVSFVSLGDGASPSGRIGSASLHLGYNRGLDSVAPGGALGGSLRLMANLGHVRPGLEGGRYALGGHDFVTPRGQRRDGDESLLHFGPVVSVGPSRGRFQPYALAGVGLYDWKAIGPTAVDPQGESLGSSRRSFLGGNLGGGVRAHAARALSFELEGRWHTNLDDVGRRRLSVLTLNAGVTFDW
jgi:hypothetical protein